MTVMIALAMPLTIILMIAPVPLIPVIAAALVTLAHQQKLKQNIAPMARFTLIISWLLINACRAAAAATNILALAQMR